ncbi:PadR family transcriptional regulator [Companilactobacillus huachuanensis]|uniref:PadR family transcriptional regulator n=1 Tax=Companilactobacillus huachuanensis TaxID=2559914 RepID=A0ABW1RKG2_9LACO|nr:helix-turn-helix transcriptional regulator [Companilactobacillus huachuanensis]
MYELFILGQLMDHPMAGYALRKAFTNIVTDDQSISFGTLYPLLDKLEQAGEISLSFEETTNNRPQKLATITVSGKKRFYELATATTQINKQSQLTFLMKVHFLHLLEREQQVFILEDFQKFTGTKLQRLKNLEAELKVNPRMVPEDISDALLVKQLQILRTKAQYDWVTELLEERKEA